MVLSISSTYHALGANLSVYVTAIGGTPPYAYSVAGGGAGGSINAVSGLYTSPPVVPANPSQCYDVITVTDSLSATATFNMLVGYPLLLVCDIIQTILGLDNNHIYIWDQKIFEPTDSLPYIVIGVVNSKPFGNTNRYKGTLPDSTSQQSINMLDTVSIDVLSRSNAAAFVTCPQVLMALNSDYAERQQELNSFFIGKLPTNFLNLSKIEGAAIPYRFRIEVALQYFVPVVQFSQYFDTFENPEILINE